MSKRLPSLELLRFVEACVRHGNFTRAAAELGVTPTAVSLRIRDLEAELGAELFHRSGPRIAATEAGAALAGRIGEAFGADPAGGGGVPGRGPRAARHLRADVRDALACAPSGALSRAAGRSPDCARRRGGAAVAPGFRRRRSHRAWRVARIPKRPHCSRSKRLPCSAPRFWPGDTCPRRRTWLRCRSCLMTIGRAGSQRPVSRRRRCGSMPTTIPTHELDAAAAMEGAGVALLSPILFAAQLHEGKLIQPFPHVLRGPAQHFLLLKDGEARPAVLRFRDWLLAEAGTTASPAPAAPSSAGTPG